MAAAEDVADFGLELDRRDAADLDRLAQDDVEVEARPFDDVGIDYPAAVGAARGDARALA